MSVERCRCAECRALDELPVHLRGWPNAVQLRLIPSEAIGETMKEDPCRAACRERCAGFGEPPCFEIGLLIFKPCDDCLLDAGAEVTEQQDPNAVIAPLL